MGFNVTRNHVRFFYYLKSKQYAYQTKIKIDREECDLKIQRPKAPARACRRLGENKL